MMTWPVTAAALVAAVGFDGGKGPRCRRPSAQCEIALYRVGHRSISGFGRIVTWFADGFFVPENTAKVIRLALGVAWECGRWWLKLRRSRSAAPLPGVLESSATSRGSFC
jgi:hypothetical protein